MTKQRMPAESVVQIAPERIQAPAYEIYEGRQGGPGDAVSDWLQAERELHATVKRFSPDIEVRSPARGERMLAGGLD